MILSDLYANNKGADQTAQTGLRLWCSQTQQAGPGFLLMPI